MRLVLLTVVSNKEPWFQEVKELYVKKINLLNPFEVEGLKALKLDRAQSEQKKKMESEKILQYLKPEDLVILLDEKGKALSSLQLAQWLEKEIMMAAASKRMVFIVGGAYGVSEEVKKRAHWTLQMGPWTLNHLVAQTVILEQIYRAFTIIKGLPYHNE